MHTGLDLLPSAAIIRLNRILAGEPLLWHTYRKDQVRLKLLKNPGDTMLGMYTYNRTVVIFAALKNDASMEERLNYKDMYLTPNVFEWETVNNIGKLELEGIKNSTKALVFIRKVKEEHGIVQPFIFVGQGKLTNPRMQNKMDSTTGKPAVTCLFDITMDSDLPDYLQYDFGLVDHF